MEETIAKLHTFDNPYFFILKIQMIFFGALKSTLKSTFFKKKIQKFFVFVWSPLNFLSTKFFFYRTHLKETPSQLAWDSEHG